MTATLRLERTALIPQGTRCIAYVRVSTEKQAGETKVSPDTQLARCKALAAERGLTVEHVIEDHESGAHVERLDRLVAACQAHPLPQGHRGLIVVYDTSRWGRFERPGMDRMFREQLYRLGWDVRIGDEPETDHEAANLFVSTGQAIAASEYRRQLRQKVIDNMPKIARQGFWQGRAPFGYSIVEVLEGKRHRLVKGNARDVVTVQRIFEWFNSGSTLQALAAKLNEEKVPGPFEQYPSHTWRFVTRKAPCGKWTSSAVRSLLNNETYTGRVIFKPREVRDDRNRPLRFARGKVPESHWVIASEHQSWWFSQELPHEPIIDRKTFDAARRRLQDRHKPRHWSKSKQPFILSQLIVCAACGGPVVGGGGRKPNAKDPDKTRNYRCRNAVNENPTCSKPILTVNQRTLETEVLARVSAHVVQLVKSGRLAQLLDEQFKADDSKKREVVLGRELESLNAQRNVIVKKIAQGLLNDEDAAEELTKVKARIVSVGRELEGLKTRPSLADRKAERDRLVKMASDFPALIKSQPAPVARELLSYWLEGPIVLEKRRGKNGDQFGTMKLREVPAGYGSVDRGRPAPARRCWRDGCRRSCRR